MPSRRVGYAVRTTEPSTILSSFDQIALRDNLNRGTDEYWERRREFISAEVRERFSRIFGADVESLDGWKKLCIHVVGTRTTGKKGVREEDLQTIEDCKKKLKNKFINLIDLVEYAQRGQSLPKKLVFHSRKGLSEYIQEEEKYFPKSDAKKVPLLKYFLITIGA
ncbi:hypothetical protein D9758_014350 [Tetrapyrgos nigripes]|uniref:Uncharacterized protein n=1 Tax=Tetrapyrgos nigripes TaxID=182062 RepID=A0A8H5C8T0_9AGAR|nr:hypothetical protein D9758_014350 [Tetrapyrgos nigripes]